MYIAVNGEMKDTADDMFFMQRAIKKSPEYSGLFFYLSVAFPVDMLTGQHISIMEATPGR
jgi:hypothetical protein